MERCFEWDETKAEANYRKHGVMSTVRYKQRELPPISQERETELKALAERLDSEIDYSDIPPLTKELWDKAVRGHFYKPVKKLTSVRIDADVLDWLKSQGKGYHTRINAILRREMIAALK